MNNRDRKRLITKHSMDSILQGRRLNRVRITSFYLVIVILPFPIILMGIQIQVHTTFKGMTSIVNMGTSISTSCNRINLFNRSFHLHQRPSSVKHLFCPTNRSGLLFTSNSVECLRERCRIFRAIRESGSIFLTSNLLPKDTIFLDRRQRATRGTMGR